MPLTIARVDALEVLDSRGDPTVEAFVELSDGTSGWAHAPSGASTGTHEAHELRDGDPKRYRGKGVAQAVANVRIELHRLLAGLAADRHPELDRRMIEADGTSDKSRLGANALVAVSCAVARAVAVSRGLPLWRYLADAFAGQRAPAIPVPMVNVLSGGLHAGYNIEFQDYLVIPDGFDTFNAALEATIAVHCAARRLLEDRGCVLTGVADEGGWGPRLASNREALETLSRAVEAAGYTPGEHFLLALDVAASHFYRDAAYDLATEGRRLTSEQMVGVLEGWCREFPVASIEDGLDEDDWTGWRALTEQLGGRIQLLGDDLFTTNAARLRRGIAGGVANAVLVKMNQIGTLTETFEVLELARSAGYRAVVSARSGETEDSFLADLAVASGAGQIKIGSVTRSERLAKYNRLLAVERAGGLDYARSFNPRGR